MYDLFNLDNNMRVVVEKLDHVNSVSVGLWIENGSRNETEKTNGISHFIEHMFFKGTSNRNSIELAKAIEDVGGQINAFTSKEATCFYIKVLNTHLELALEILSDMIFNSLFLEEEIEKEKGVINEEINMNDDSPEDVLSDICMEGIYGKDSISLPILGTKESISHFDRKTLKDYVDKYYVPENTVLSICGNFDVKTIHNQAEKYFGNWESKNSIITQYSNPAFEGVNVFKDKDIEQIHMAVSFKGIESGSKEIYPLALLCNALGGGASSILFEKLREELGLCYTTYAYPSSHINTGCVTIYAGVNTNTVKEAYETINKVVNDFTKKKFNSEELRVFKEQLKGAYILGLESTSSKMFSNGKSALFLRKINTPNDIMKKIEDVNEESIMEVMNKTFKEGIISSAFVGKSCENFKDILHKPLRMV